MPASCLNIIVGENGSGKTSLLEAIHYVSYGRSFRTSKYQNLITHESSAFVLFARVFDQHSGVRKVGLERKRNGQVDMRIDGEKLNRILDFASRMPTQVFTPLSSELLTGSPGNRRSFVDWLLFHVKQRSFSELSKRYSQVLKQRNAMLKTRQLDSQQEGFWLAQLNEYGSVIDHLRQEIVEQLKPHFSHIIAQFLPEFSFEITYYRGWEKDANLADSLATHSHRDRAYGFTSVGPHKADIRIKADGKSAQDILSRGQLRVLTAALQLSQSRLLYQQNSERCLFLLDDIGAELDKQKRGLFLQELLKAEAQIFVTATDVHQVTDVLTESVDKKVFHVKQGIVNEEKIING